jgi:hypothetical protein
VLNLAAMRGMARVAIVLVGVALVAAVAASNAAASSEHVEIYLRGPHGHRYRDTLQLKLFPRQGVAVVTTLTGGTDFEEGGGVAYATRTRKGLRAGRVDVHFPGLGRIVGRVLGDGEPEPARGKTGCAATESFESGHFVGHLVFRGSGGYRTWRASRVKSYTTRNTSCREKIPPKTLFGYLDETGTPALEGGSSLASVLGSGYENGKRSVQFIAEIHGRGPEEAAGFTVFDDEWLAGHRIAANRWMSRRGVPLGDHFEIAPGARKPPSATLRPPAPFSGDAIYSRKGHTLLGDLSVDLLGLRLRLAGPHTVAFLDNSE